MEEDSNRIEHWVKIAESVRAENYELRAAHRAMYRAFLHYVKTVLELMPDQK